MAGLYRRSEPTLGWTGPRQRYSYLEVKRAKESPDRWRTGFPDYTVHTRGRWFDPYNQNVLKGDYPLIGNRTFLVVTGTSETMIEGRNLPTPSNIPARRPGEFGVFGRPGQRAFVQQFGLSINVFNGDTAFEPPLWQVRFTPVFNVDNTLGLEEVGNTVPDVRQGVERSRHAVGIQELFAEIRLGVLSPYFDFVSLRLGRQPFLSDFRGFIFKDDNFGLRIFGNLGSNRSQFNLVLFDMVEHETNSELLRSGAHDRSQCVFIANCFRQDAFDLPGYTAEISFHRNIDRPSFKYDENGVLVRPDPVGLFKVHRVEADYLGWLGDGHIGPVNVSHSFYQVFGRDSHNPVAARAVNINAQQASLEASVDHDWLRYKASLFFASGDASPNDKTARGFDAIIDSSNFAGGEFSFWGRQSPRLQGVNLKQRDSLIPDLRSSKLEGQSNFVNPGLRLWNVGVDAEVTPKLKLLVNLSGLSFDHTEPLELFLFQTPIPRGIGLDFSLGAQYRPALNQNIVWNAGVAGLAPGPGFTAIYETDRTLYQAFTELRLQF
ncbi:MAG: hypothetical protein HY815_03805 [Candidatus Riflebacteria bacterium]|nr:hypothetical protein [Candidatus Riflebacteria bacterium]